MELTAKQKVIKFVTPILFPLLKLYWKSFKPHTYGSKVIIRNGDKYLLVRNAYGNKNWTFPGGKVEIGETAEAAGVREVFEEVGLVLKKPTFIGEIISTVEGKFDHVSIYFSDVERAVVKADPFEIEEYQWFREKDFPKIGPVAQMMWDKFKNDPAE